MVWIDEVAETSPEGGVCYVNLKASGLYFSEGRLRESSLIEFFAQGFGFVAAAQSVRSGAEKPTGLKRAFLVAVTQCQLADTSKVIPGTRLKITLSDVKQVGPIQLFKASAETDFGTPLGTASLKVFSE